MRILVVVLLCLSSLALAVQVGVGGEWYKPFVGVPLNHAKPVFHRVAVDAKNTRTRSVVLVATERNVLAALEPADGSIGEWCFAF
jgi:ER membrane protein complex subunit 1